MTEAQPETPVPSVIQALNAVMADVQSVSKTERNEQQKYLFRGVDAVVNAVGPALRTHCVVVVPIHVEYDVERYTTKSGAQMKGVTTIITFRFYGPAGDFIDAQAAGESSDAGDKAMPKAHSVTYRTLLLQALCIPTDDPDPDSEAHERAAQPAPETPKKPTPTQKKEFTRLLGRLTEIDKERKWQEEIIEPWVLKTAEKPISELSRGGYDTLLAKVQGLLDRAEELVAAGDVPFDAPPGAEHVDQAAAEQGMSDLPLTGAPQASEDDIPEFGS